MNLKGSIKKSRMQGILGTNPAAIPITVDNQLSLSSTNPVQNRVITAAITNRLWSDEVKTALLQIVEKVAYVDEDGQDYYDALYDALYPPTNLDSIGAVFDSSATIYNTDTLDDLKQYLTVTAYYTDGTSETVTTYTLSGSMDAGTQTITVSYGGKTTTFTVTVVEWLTSISAVFTQGSSVYGTNSTLDELRSNLVVTATYSDNTTETVTDYTLSGTLVRGTSTITVSYGGKTANFNVNIVTWVVTDNDLVIAGLSADPNSDTTGLYPYTITSYIKRLSYYKFDLMLEAGKTYQFTTTTNVNTAEMGIQAYNQTVLDHVANNTLFENSEIDDTGWGAITRTYAMPTGYLGVRFTYRESSSNPNITTKFVTQVIIDEVV